MLRDTLFFYKAKCNNTTFLDVELIVFGRITIGYKITTYHVGNKSPHVTRSNFMVFCNSTSNVALLHSALNLNVSRNIITI